LRKHKTALIALAVYHFVFFFPVIFMGRVVSPNDVYFNFDPWAVTPHAQAQNSLINDPPTSYLTLMSLVKSGWSAFHWNPYIASGVPGFGSSAAAVLSPFILLPTVTLPLSWVYTGIVFLKLNVAFWFAYFWLREERLGKRAAAIGAIVVAAAGICAVRWLWQSTNATSLYPALLWIVRRTWSKKRTPVWAMTLIAVAYALAGFPAAMAYGAYLAVAYAIFLTVREWRLPWVGVGLGLATVVLALAIASPSLVPFVQFVRRTGYLEAREQASLQLFLPHSHWRSFFDPERLGNPALKDWIGDRALGALNNFVESTIYVGVVAIPLIVLALANRRARTRWFWFSALIVILGCMFGLGGFPKLIARLPGFKYSSLARTAMLLPMAAGYLAAAGAALIPRTLRKTSEWWRLTRDAATETPIFLATLTMTAIAIAAAFDLGVFAGRFYPYLEPGRAEIHDTPAIRFLRSEPGPFRVAPFFTYLWPNVAELVRIEDVRSHFSSEAAYRQLLQQVDPTVWGGASTILEFNSLKFNFADPIVSMLGVRYYLEQNSIDIIKWTTFANTVPGVKESGALIVKPGTFVQRTVRVDAEPFYAIELPVSVDATMGPKPRLNVTLARDGVIVYRRAFTPDDISVMSKVYVPLRPYARLGESVTLRVEAMTMRASLLGAADRSFFYGRVTTPVIFDRQFPDGRLFRNVAEVPRFHPVSKVRKGTIDDLLAAGDIDLGEEAIVTDRDAALPRTSAGARARLTHYEPSLERVTTDSAAPFLLASSEKLSPELRIRIDGRLASAIGINALFAGVEVPAGHHEVVFERQLARGWWWVAVAGLVVLVAIAVGELTRVIRDR
jgi:hypothetical protein